MDLLQLKYFQVVAKLQHLTKSAEALHISQPALSKMISTLEKSLGYELFDRKGRQIKLNRLGEAYLATVEKVFNELNEGERNLAYLAERQNNRLSIAVTIPNILPELLGTFLELHPDARFRQYHASTEKIKQQILSGEVDVGISTFPVHGPDLEWQPVLEEEILLSVPLKHRLAARKEISLIEVKDDPFIVPAQGYSFRDMTVSFCAQAGFYPNFAFEGDETGITLELVEKGLGIAFFPQIMTSRRMINMAFAKLRIADPVCRRTVGLVWHKKRDYSKMAKDFIEHTTVFLKCKEEASKEAAP